MPDLPNRLFHVPSIIADKAKAKASKLYWNHPTITVYQYMHLSKPEQARINLECRQREKGTAQPG
jgi:hypothetical protein